MLTKDLLEVDKRKPNIEPRYRDVDEYRPLAEQVIDAYEVGRTRGEIQAETADLETHDTFKLVRGLSKLLERSATFEQQSPVPPSDLRKAAFERGFVTNATERQQVISEVASEFGLTSEAVEDGLWADREPEAVLVSPPAIDVEELLRRYNLSLTQTLLFDALELTFTASDNYQEIFGLLSYLGLMYTVDEDLSVTVTGPATLFKQTRKYGTSLAKLLPSIMKADEWSVSAPVETEVGDDVRIYEFELDSSRDDLFPEQAAVESFDSEVERDFAVRIDSLADGWTVVREPTILRAGNRVMIPDFSFERERGGDGAEFYLEVVGFWTPEYLEEKIAKVRQVESEVPMVLAVNEALNCTTEDFDGSSVDQVFFYTDTIPVKPVLSRLQAIDERHIERDAAAIADEGIDVPTDTVTPLAELADQRGVEPGAIRRYLDENAPGVISNEKYVPEAVLGTVEADVEALDSPTLADVAPILERYGVAQNVLEAIGYTVQYTSLDADEATVRKRDR